MSKRTIVVWQTGKLLWYSELTDQCTKPARGEGYVFNGTRYEVVAVDEALGAMSADGTRLRTGAEKLLELLAVSFGEVESLGMFARLTNIGSGDGAQNSTTASGVILSGNAIAGEFDNVVLVRLKTDRKSAPVSVIRLDQLLVAVTGPSDPDAAASSGSGSRRPRKPRK